VYSREQIEAAGLDDFRVFLRLVWDFLGLPPPTRVQLDIAYNLQHAPRRFILQAFRGVGKSWITAAFIVWNLFLDPQKKIMVVSASKPLADDMSKFCKQIINGMPILQHLAAKPGQRDSAISWDVGPAKPSKDPSVKSVGITGQLTGSRADIIVADDIEIPKNSYTHLLRERLSELVKEFDAVLKPGGQVIYLGTPQNEQSIYPRLEKRGYITRIWTSEVVHNPSLYHGRLADFVVRLIEAGIAPLTPLEPERFSREDLDDRLASYGVSGYALQFLLDTNPSDKDKHPLKCRDLIVYDIDHEVAPVKIVWGSSRDEQISDLQCGGLDGDVYHAPSWRSPEMGAYTGTVMAIDPSGRGKDETAYAIIKNMHGVLYLVECGGFIDGFGESTLKQLAGAALRWKVNDVVIERNYGGGMFDQLLKPYLANVGYGRIDDEWNSWSSTMKEQRICDTLQPVLENHKLVVSRRVIEKDIVQQADDQQYSLIQQMTRMERVKNALPHEDRIEAVSMAVAYFTERMARDQDKTLRQHKEDALDKELEKFMENAFYTGNPPDGLKPLTWA
jgi:hypothetical protein